MGTVGEGRVGAGTPSCVSKSSSEDLCFVCSCESIAAELCDLLMFEPHLAHCIVLLPY